MAAVSDETSSEELNQVFKGLFFISKWFGLFPFAIKNGEYRKSSLLYAISICMVGTWSAYVITFVDFNKWEKEDHLLKKLSHILPIFTLFTVFPCNIIWLTFNTNKLDYVMSILKKIDRRIANVSSGVHVCKKIFISVLLVELAAEMSIDWTNQCSGKFVYTFMLFSTFLIADQFASVLYVLRRYYSHLCENLDLGTAVDFTNIHDLLGKCCREANDCFAPQLLLIMISAFVYIVSGLYTIIINYINTKTVDFVQFYHLIMIVATIFHFLTGCRLTTLQSKKYDNLLYRYAINDKTKSIMRNNRILLHFKAMKDLEFSAMEFFNFDYALICSVVSTATTYIVILVQFS